MLRLCELVCSVFISGIPGLSRGKRRPVAAQPSSPLSKFITRPNIDILVQKDPFHKWINFPSIQYLHSSFAIF